MSLLELKVIDFINEVDSDSPAPGGGSVSALASALGIGLSKMVSHLTIGKKKYLALDENVRNEYENNFKYLDELKTKMVPLIDKDTDAFNMIMNAFKLPKETDEEKNIRLKEIEKATLEAIKVPFEVATLSLEVLKTIIKMLPYGNNNAISDIGVGTLLLYSGLEGALLNVKINLSGLSDQSIINNYREKCESILRDGKHLKDEILNKVHDKL